jgi:arylsulfatase
VVRWVVRARWNDQAPAFDLLGDEVADVGIDEATNVTDAYQEGDNRFSGRIDKATIDLM